MGTQRISAFPGLSLETPRGNCEFKEERSRNSVISSSSDSLRKMQSFLAPATPGKVIRGAWAGSEGWGVCSVPKAKMVPSLGAPLVCHWAFHSGSSVYSLCGDALEALKETVCSCFFCSVPDTLSCLLVPTLPGPQPSCECCGHHPRVTNTHIVVAHIKGPDATGLVIFADCPFLMGQGGLQLGIRQPLDPLGPLRAPLDISRLLIFI